MESAPGLHGLTVTYFALEFSQHMAARAVCCQRKDDTCQQTQPQHVLTEAMLRILMAKLLAEINGYPSLVQVFKSS